MPSTSDSSAARSRINKRILPEGKARTVGRPTTPSSLSIVVCVVLAVSYACVEQTSLGPPESRSSSRAIVVAGPDLGESPERLELAAQVPTFAGLYFSDSGELVVRLTDISRLADVAQRVRAKLGTRNVRGTVVRGESVPVVAELAEYTFLQLAQYRAELRGRVFQISGVVALDVHERTNRVKIGVIDGAAHEQVTKLADELGIPPGAINIWELPAPRTSSHTLQGSMGSNIQGGWQIVTYTPAGSAFGACTLGFPARRSSNGDAVFVTNTHCTATLAGYDGGAAKQSGNTIGYEIADPTPHTCGYIPDPCRNADVALFSAAIPIQLGRIARTTSSSGCENCAAPLTVDHSNPTLTITGKNGNIIENETLHKIGRTTGWTYGAVEDACADYELDDGLVRQCSDRVDYSSDEGDSGSPVFSVKADGTVDLRGIHFGYVGGIYDDALMSNYDRIVMDLGDLTVYDPGAPVATINGPTEIPPNVQCAWEANVTAGIPPFTYQWSGLLTGSSSILLGTPSGSGWLYLQITDDDGRQDSDAMYVSVESGLPPMCQ